MKLAALFSDHAVIQRDISIPVWGWTEPQVQVKAKLAGVVAETRSGSDGRFLLRLPPLPAGGPHELQVSAAGKTARARDVLIGEVWVASGQSNMQWTLSQCGAQGAEAMRGADKPGIRVLTVPRTAVLGRQQDIDAGWVVATPKAADFSAVAWHFADRLHDALKVPVGIIDSSWGGTIVETWTSREALVQNPDTRAWVQRYEANINWPAYWQNPSAPDAVRFPSDPGNQGVKRGWADADFSDADWTTMKLPCSWQGAGYNYSGVFWFRLSVDVPAGWAGKDLSLQIGSVDKQDVTYFNGKKVGATGKGFEQEHWNKNRDYKVPGKLVKAGRNVIAVRAYSFVYAGGLLGPAEFMRLSRADGKGGDIALAGTWRCREEHNLGLIQPPTPVMGPGNANSPYMLHDNMIHPLMPYAIRGAIWYQGESNVANADKYRSMLTTMIRDWRRAWGQGDFPFIQVQLANYRQPSGHQPESLWARLREAQLQTLSEPDTGMAVTIDIGEAANIHPMNKKDVGRRLAQWALSRAYGKRETPSGPLFRDLVFEGDKIRLHFDHVGSGLTAKGVGSLSHFAIAGLDRRFVDAQAAIDGDTVVVHSPDVQAPLAVRYAWADNPEGCNLFNADGLPATPFRTDHW